MDLINPLLPPGILMKPAYTIPSVDKQMEDKLVWGDGNNRRFTVMKAYEKLCNTVPQAR